MLVTSLYLALLTRSLWPTFQPHMHQLPWNTSASASAGPKMSLFHVAQKHKINPVQHIDVVFVAFPFHQKFENHNLMRQAILQLHTPMKIFVLSMAKKCNNILLGLRLLCCIPCVWHFSTINCNNNANFAQFL